MREKLFHTAKIPHFSTCVVQM